MLPKDLAFRQTVPIRPLLAGLALAGALAGFAGPAAAQYYIEEETYFPRGYGYYERYAPRPPAPIPPRAIGRLALRDFGLAQVDRLVTTRSAYIVDGQTAQGRRTRLIVDLYSGELIDRVRLPDDRREAPRLARTDPREDERPAGPRLIPRPPERPPSLRPPGQASAPATSVPPSPAVPPRPPEAVKPAEPPPASASAPATTVPRQPAAPAVPTPGPADPATGAPKPGLVNPQDVRGTNEPERKPPLAARSDDAGVAVPPVQLPPVQLEDLTPSQPRPETPAVPVTPLD